MRLELDRGSPTPLHLQIAQQIRRSILKGELAEGSRLPPTRKLAEMLGVNRSTVVQAYNKLWAEGLIESHVGRGTVVRRAEATVEFPISSLPWETFLATHSEAIESSIRELMRLFAQEDVISFAAGVPAPEHYPLEELTELFHKVLMQEGRRLLERCAVEGRPRLREWIAEELAGGISPNEILIVTGSQQGLYLLAQALLEPGDSIVVEAPTYMGALSGFRAVGARLIGVPIDEMGMDLDMLERVLARTQPKFIYTLPTFQNPSGTTLNLERRRRMLELAYRHHVPIVEDDPYSLLRYEGESLPSLKALDAHGYVIHLSTFSKVLFPGLRVGWLAAPKRAIERLAPLKRVMDLFTNAPAQAVLYELGRRGLLERHLERVREEYRKRRDAMAQALERYCPKLRFGLPEGGYYIWSRLPRGVWGRALLREAAREGVTFLPGEFFFADGQGQEWVRLTFVSQPPEVIEEGIRRLSQALRRLMRKPLEEATEEMAVTRPMV
jgi:DNA-binding transcriptional MocR family regulator